MSCSNSNQLISATRRRSMQAAVPPPDYFDNLRINATIISNVDKLSTSIYEVTVNSSLGDETYRLVDIVGFFSFTNGTHPRPGVPNDAAAMLLAMYHFNNIHLSPILNVKEIGDCNIRLTGRFNDSQLSSIATTRAITKILQQNSQLSTPAPGAVIGALRSSQTSPLAILTGVNNIPQLSYASTSSFFDVKEQYPLFGRTVTNSDGEAAVAAQFFNSIGATHVGVLFITDAYGSALQKSFQDIALSSGIVTSSVALSFGASPDGPEFPNAVAELQSTLYRTFYVICTESQFIPIMKAAIDHGIVGKDYLWIFPGFELLSIFDILSFPSGSPLIGATAGIGVLVFQGGVMRDSLKPGVDYLPALQANATSGFETFRRSWREAANDTSISSAFRLKIQQNIPDLPEQQLDLEPSQFGPLVYDAVLAFGISMCRAGSNVSAFTGPEVFDNLRQLDFEGASGRVLLDNQTGTRVYTTMTFQLWNARAFETLDKNGLSRFELVPTNFWQDSVWEALPGQPFVYSDGTTTPPPSLPPVVMNYNFIGLGSRSAGYALMGLVMLCSIVSALWSATYCNERVVRSSQPMFLFMTSLGTFVMASTILPLSMDNSFVVSSRGLDVACMASPAIYLFGSVLVFSVLYAKIRGVYQAYKEPEIEFIHVTTFDMLNSFFVLFLVNAAIFIPWIIVAPLRWHRHVGSAYDAFGRNVDSYGTCANERAWPFGALVFVINVGMLILANYRAFVCRNVETEYRESRYVSISMASILQAWSMGVPIAIVVWRNPKARFFVETAIVFITALGVLLLVYVPKMLAIHKDRVLALERSKKEAYTNFAQRTKRSDHDDEDNHRNDAALQGTSLVSQEDGNELKMETKTASTYLAEEKNEEESETDGAYAGEGEANLESIDCASEKQSEKKSCKVSFTQDNDVNDFEEEDKLVTASPRPKWVRQVKRDKKYDPKTSRSFRLPIRGKSTSLLTTTSQTGTTEVVGRIKIVHNPRSERNLLVTNGRELSREQFNEFLNYSDKEEEDKVDPDEHENSEMNSSQRSNLGNHDVQRNCSGNQIMDAAGQGDLLLDVDDIVRTRKDA